MDDYMDFVDNIRHIYLDELICGPAIEHMFSPLSPCPKLARRLVDASCVQAQLFMFGSSRPKSAQN